jgi:Type II secretion system protein B
MSIILDALRKAEASRHAQDRIGLVGTPLTRAPWHTRIPRWFPIVGVVLLLSLGVGAYFTWRSEPAAEMVASTAPSTTARTTSPSPPAARTPPRPEHRASTPPAADTPGPSSQPGSPEPPAAASANEADSDRSDLRPLAQEARIADTPPAVAPAAKARGGSVEVRDLDATGMSIDTSEQPGRKPGKVEVRDLLGEQGLAPPVPPQEEAPKPNSPAPAERSATAAPAPASTPAAASASPAPAAARQAPAVPSVDDLVASGQLNPPELSLDMHAWSADPSARFVYINMRRYHVGDTTHEGAVVEDITPDGVVLLLQGKRFLLQSR